MEPKKSKATPVSAPNYIEQETEQMTNNSNYGTNYALFRWTGVRWEVIDNACDYGCVPMPPDSPGAHEGQIVPTACQPMWEGMERPSNPQA